MIAYEYLIEAEDFIINQWGDEGRKLIDICLTSKPYNATYRTFYQKECIKNPLYNTSSVLYGISRVWPKVYKFIPMKNRGPFAYECLLYTLLLLGVDTTVSY